MEGVVLIDEFTAKFFNVESKYIKKNIAFLNLKDLRENFKIVKNKTILSTFNLKEEESENIVFLQDIKFSFIKALKEIFQNIKNSNSTILLLDKNLNEKDYVSILEIASEKKVEVFALSQSDFNINLREDLENIIIISLNNNMNFIKTLYSNLKNMKKVKISIPLFNASLNLLNSKINYKIVFDKEDLIEIAKKLSKKENLETYYFRIEKN